MSAQSEQSTASMRPNPFFPSPTPSLESKQQSKGSRKTGQIQSCLKKTFKGLPAATLSTYMSET